MKLSRILNRIFSNSEVLIFLIFIIISVFFYSSILSPSTQISGSGGGDDFADIYGMWWNGFVRKLDLNQNLSTFTNYPFGVKTLSFVVPIWILIANLAKYIKEVFLYNIVNFISFPLAAMGMYFLSFYVTRSRSAAMISGLIFAFTPYHFIRATGHLTLAHIEWIPLCVLFLLMMVDEGSRHSSGIPRGACTELAECARNDDNDKDSSRLVPLDRTIKSPYFYAVLAGVFFALNFFTDYYYGLFLSVFVVIFFAVWVFVGSRLRSNSNKYRLKPELQKVRRSFAPLSMTWRPMIIFGLVSVLLVGSYLGVIFLSGGKEAGDMVSFARPIEDLYHWGGSLKYYFIPWQENYLLGNFWNKIFYQGNGIPDGEWMTYLGWPGILLAGYGVWRWGRERRGSRLVPMKSGLARTVDKSPAFAGTPQRLHFDFIMILFIVTAIAATIFSFPPPLSPSKWIYKILPQFRVYARFFVFVSLAVSVLAGVGLKYLFEWVNGLWNKGILRRFAPQNDTKANGRLKFYIFTIISIAVLVDFVPSFKTTDVSKAPLEYVWLKDQPENNVIAEYPYADGPTPTYLFWQRIHQKPMINGEPEPDTTGKEKIRGLIYDVTNPRTPRILKKLGVTYLILHKDQYNQPYWQGALIPPDKKLPKKVKMAEINPGLKLVKRFNLTYVYEIR